MPPRPEAQEERIQVATRVSTSLTRRLKAWCVLNDVTTQDFVAGALREKLRRAGRPRRRS